MDRAAGLLLWLMPARLQRWTVQLITDLLDDMHLAESDPEDDPR